MKKKILLVDDELILLKGLKYGLEQDSYEIITASDGEEALEIIARETFDLIILDLMLPKIDGLEVCRKIREKFNIPIIILTARGDDSSKVLGLEYGADDYITKPFNILEVKARIKAVMRRKSRFDVSLEIMKVDNLEVNTKNKRVFKDSKEIFLTSKEYELLHFLMSNAGKIYTRNDLLIKIWGETFPGDERTVDVHIRRLREKIEEISGNPEFILTKWGTGYYFKN